MLNFNELKGIQKYFQSHYLFAMQKDMKKNSDIIQKKMETHINYVCVVLFSSMIPWSIGVITDNTAGLVVGVLVAAIATVAKFTYDGHKEKIISYYLRKLGTHKILGELNDFLENSTNQREILIEVNKLESIAPEEVKKFKLALMNKEYLTALHSFKKMDSVLEAHTKSASINLYEIEQENKLKEFESSLGVEREMEFNGNYNYKKLI